MTDPTLHPNLARVAAAYDEIVDRMSRNVISPAQAFSEIAQLEARDDQGVRWSIDPQSGDWVRKTFTGDQQYDTPPTHGYATPDAFAYNPDSAAYNPNLQIQLTEVDPALTHGPSQLAGATRTVRPARTGPKVPAVLENLLDVAAGLSRRVKVAVVAALVVLLALGLHSCDDDTATPAPTPSVSTTQGKDKAPVKKATKSKTKTATPSTKK